MQPRRTALLTESKWVADWPVTLFLYIERFHYRKQ